MAYILTTDIATYDLHTLEGCYGYVMEHLVKQGTGNDVLSAMENLRPSNTDEVKHLKGTILTAGFMLAQEKAEAARLRDELRTAALDHDAVAMCFINEGRSLSASWHTKKAAKIRQLLNSKGPADNT